MIMPLRHSVKTPGRTVSSAFTGTIGGERGCKAGSRSDAAGEDESGPEWKKTIFHRSGHRGRQRQKAVGLDLGLIPCAYVYEFLACFSLAEKRLLLAASLRRNRFRPSLCLCGRCFFLEITLASLRFSPLPSVSDGRQQGKWSCRFAQRHLRSHSPRCCRAFAGR